MTTPLSALDDDGSPVDWWFMYKVAGKGRTDDGRKLTGTEYVYFDSNAPGEAKLALSPNHCDAGGALKATLDQLYVPDAMGPGDLGWYFYNDENPINGQVVGSRGHTKGVVAFDLATDTAFWLVQSTPKFPGPKAYAYPHTGTGNAQTLLCVTLADASVAKAIAAQQYVAQQPNVYHSSAAPASLPADDPRVQLINNEAAPGEGPVHVIIPFNSKGGLKFMSIAKNPKWGLDFYNDLVGPTLTEDLEVETWEHDPTPQPPDSDKGHTVVAMNEVDLHPLGVDISWSESCDHAKLALSAAHESPHYVCVGDINYTIAQEKRGGGTVAFQCEALWSGLTEILKQVTPIPRAAATV